MGALDQFGINISSLATSGMGVVLVIIVLVLIITGLVALYFWNRNRKAYNIPLFIITPRSNGLIPEVNRGIGGYFQNGNFTEFRVKRKKLKTVSIPPPPSNYLLYPTRTLVLVQKGIGDYEAVLPESLNWITTPEGRVPIVQLRAKNQDATAWGFEIERTARQRFTFASIWEKYGQFLSFMLFVFILFIIMYINWRGQREVVDGLRSTAEAFKDAANALREYSAGGVVVSP